MGRRLSEFFWPRIRTSGGLSEYCDETLAATSYGELLTG
jgi:hypothetical protein